MSASTCSQCGAPLPEGSGSVTCRFCGAVTQVQGPVGPTQIRAAVRQVLAEERRPRPPPAGDTRMVGRVVGLIIAMVVMLAVFIGSGVMRPTPVVHRPTTTPMPGLPHEKPSVPKPPPVVVVPPIPKLGFGEAEALGLSADAVYLASRGELVKWSRSTGQEAWRATLGHSGGGDVVPLQGRVAYANQDGVFFFDDGDGSATGQWLWPHGGFKVSACAAGPTTVLVKTVFDGTLHFDAKTAKKSTGGSCALMEDLRCAPGQRCGWGHFEREGLRCRYELHTASGLISFCEEDGTNAKVVAFFAGKSLKWKSTRAEGASSGAFAAVLDGVLVVADGRVVEAFDPVSGAAKWTHARQGSERAMVATDQNVFVFESGSVLELDAQGTEVSRWPRAEGP